VKGGGGGGVSVRAALVTLFVTFAFAFTQMTVWHVLIAALVSVQAKAFG
jgi:hypothetical protein